MSNWFSKNFWLKVIALILAIIVWSYAREELKKTPGYKAENTPYSKIPAEIPQN